MKLFVPGRICMFGEHSDWAGQYRRINAELDKGYTIIAGTNQGLHAEVTPHPNKFILYSTFSDGSRQGPLELTMDKEALLAEAERGGMFSYAAGVAYQVLTHYRVRGLVIDNYFTDLPIRKGLSSSAAICVLVARAFNRIYDLKMTIRGEMEFAYLGEITTPSRCGRMDQGCAYGNRPIMMTFDGERMDVAEITVKRDLYFVIVDLNAQKDTLEILNKLNKCYPFAETDIHRNVQRYLGPISAGITRDACAAIREGDAETLGQLMRTAQAQFDANVKPACPSQLAAPVLHTVLSYEPLKPHMLGAKGVGSQGDGTAQILARDEDSQRAIIEIIERDLRMPCFKLALQSQRKIRKAVIPAAGFGTRLFPATKAMKKELFPVIDRNGVAKPALLVIVEEVLAAGVEEIAVVIQKNDRAMFEEFFCMPPAIENYNKLSKANQAVSAYILEVGQRITFISQDSQEGFGHAVYCTREWIGDEPFLLVLGDHIYASDAAEPCAAQVVNVYKTTNQSVVGLKVTPGAETGNFGCVAGTWHENGKILSITEFSEKPDIEYARSHLQIDGLGEDQFLTVFGQYILTPTIFKFLEEHIQMNIREHGEFQLTSCLDKLRQEEGFMGVVVNGKRFDIGLPESYRQTVIDFRSA